MGCSPSKLDNEAVLKLCKDRIKFIKQAVEHRMNFASGHIAYMQSMKRVSAALRDYIIGHEPRPCDIMLDSVTQDCSQMKKTTASFACKSPRSYSVAPVKSEPNSCCKINYLKSGGSPSVSVELRPPPQSPETVRIEAYTPVHHFEMGSILEIHSSPVSSPNNRPNCSPISAQTSQWDFFWNPFISLDYYGYPTSSLDENTLNDENARGRQVREEESISELEERKEKKEIDERINKEEERAKADVNSKREEDVDDTVNNMNEDGTISGPEKDQTNKGLQFSENQSIEVAKCENISQISGKETAVTDSKEETPGYTVYINQRLTSMEKIAKDLQGQFMIAHNSANDVSLILQARRAKYSSTSNDLTVMEMLNPITLFRSPLSRSSSSRFLVSSSTSRDEDYECSSNFSEESSCMFTGNHQSTLEKLYAWEKKLYQEVRAGERIRKAFEKKCAQLRNQDMKGQETPLSGKTRASLTDLHTQIKVSIHLVEAASKRIETLRDEELEPQILELVQGLAKMWKVMAECHQLQKCTLDEAKILLAGKLSTFSAPKKQAMSPSKLQKLANSAANLETELRNWRACFETWIVSQRSYVQALTGWFLRCVLLDPDTSKLPFVRSESFGGSSMFNICIQWSRFLDAIQEAPVLDGLDHAAADVCSLYAQQQLQENSCRKISASKSCGGEREPLGVLEIGQFEDEVVNAEKMAEAANRVLFAGMSVTMDSLTEFAFISAEGYANLVKQWENAKQLKSSDTGK